jgi:two-component system, OmpR family, response regulator
VSTDPRTRVLLIEDDPHVLFALARALEPEFAVVPCLGGREGLRRLREGHHDVIVVDVVMPAITGQVVYHELPFELRARVVLMYGGAPTPELAAFVGRVRAGGVTVLEKPFALNDLRAAIRRLHRT